MRKSSIHIEAGKVGEFFHNSRETPTANSIFSQTDNYCNLTAKEALNLYQKELKKRAELYTQRTGQKLQKKAITLLSSIVNLKENSTREDLQNVVKLLEQKLNTKVIQFAIHEDEGHIDENTGENKINYHAHILFMGLDNNGKSVRKKLTKNLLRELQTDVAKVLKMERGSREKKTRRLDTYDYKQHKKLEAQNTKELNKKIAELTKENEALKQKNNELKKENETLKISVKDLKKDISNLRTKMIQANQNQEQTFTREDYATLSKIKQQLNAKNIQEIAKKLEDYEQIINNRIKKQLTQKLQENSKGIFTQTISTQTALNIVNNTCNVTNTKTIKKIFAELREAKGVKKELEQVKKELEQVAKDLKVKEIEAYENESVAKYYYNELEKQKEITREKEYLIQQLNKQLNKQKEQEQVQEVDINNADVDNDEFEIGR